MCTPYFSLPPPNPPLLTCTMITNFLSLLSPAVCEQMYSTGFLNYLVLPSRLLQIKFCAENDLIQTVSTSMCLRSLWGHCICLYPCLFSKCAWIRNGKKAFINWLVCLCYYNKISAKGCCVKNGIMFILSWELPALLVQSGSSSQWSRNSNRLRPVRSPLHFDKWETVVLCRPWGPRLPTESHHQPPDCIGNKFRTQQFQKLSIQTGTVTYIELGMHIWTKQIQRKEMNQTRTEGSSFFCK